MKLMKSLPSQAFIDFEAKTVFIDPRLKFKVLVNNLETGTLLPEQITDIHALHSGDPAAAYTALKALIMKTYTSVDAPEQARNSLLSVRMNPTIGPQSLNNLLTSAKKTCDLLEGAPAAVFTAGSCSPPRRGFFGLFATLETPDAGSLGASMGFSALRPRLVRPAGIVDVSKGRLHGLVW